MKENSIIMDIHNTLLYEDLTSKEVREKYKTKYQKSISSHRVDQDLYRLKKNHLVKIIDKKKGKNVYRSRFRQNYLAIVKAISKLNNEDLPFELRRIIYELIIKLLPADIELLMDKLLKNKEKELFTKKNLSEIKDLEIIKNLMYS